MMSPSAPATDAFPIILDVPVGSAGTVSNDEYKAHNRQLEGFAALATAFSLVLSQGTSSSGATPAMVPTQVNSVPTGTRQEQTEQDITKWFWYAREGFDIDIHGSGAWFYPKRGLAHENVAPHLERSLASLMELPARVKANDIFENEIDEVALKSASKFLTHLGRLIVMTGEQWHEPHLSTEDRGDVEFAWWHRGKTLIFSITATDVHYLQAWGSNVRSEMDEGINPTHDKLIELWRWLYG